MLKLQPVPKERFDTWVAQCVEEIKKAFGSDSAHVPNFLRAGAIFVHVGDYDADGERSTELKAKNNALAAQVEALDFAASTAPAAEIQKPQASIAPALDSKDVFVVHGHDDGTKTKVARVLERLGFRAVILHEQANLGLTIIEKFERHAQTAAFAVVLFTPDDVGGVKSEQPQLHPRARQNVILELGYFIGKLGRPRVAVLHSQGVELPSDILGVVYTPLDANWEFALAKELRGAGLSVDFNRLG